MIGRRDKQRIKVNYLHSQVLQVIHLVQHSLQIPSIKFPHIHLRRIPVPIRYLMHRFINIAIFIGQYIIGGISVAEAIHVDLIHYRSFGPVRRLKSRYDNKIIILVYIMHQSLGIIIAYQRTGTQLKIVGSLFLSQLKLTRIIVKQLVRLYQLHQIFLFLTYQKNLIHIIFCRPKTNRHFIIGIWFLRRQIFTCSIRKQCPFVENRTHV